MRQLRRSIDQARVSVRKVKKKKTRTTEIKHPILTYKRNTRFNIHSLVNNMFHFFLFLESVRMRRGVDDGEKRNPWLHCLDDIYQKEMSNAAMIYVQKTPNEEERREKKRQCREERAGVMMTVQGYGRRRKYGGKEVRGWGKKRIVLGCANGLIKRW